MKCPNCGAVIVRHQIEKGLVATYACGTKTDHTGKTVFESKACLRRQIDQLKEKLDATKAFEQVVASVSDDLTCLAMEGDEALAACADRLMAVIPN